MTKESEYLIYVKNKKTGVEEWIDPIKFLEYIDEILSEIVKWRDKMNKWTKEKIVNIFFAVGLFIMTVSGYYIIKFIGDILRKG